MLRVIMRTTFIVSQVSSRKAAAWELNGWNGVCSFTEVGALGVKDQALSERDHGTGFLTQNRVGAERISP